MNNIINDPFSGPKLYQCIMFEIISYLGRKLFKHRSRIIPQKHPILLDVGAGSNYKENWTHVDFYLNPRFKFWKKYPPRKKPEIQMDIRYPFNCPDNIVDGIYSGHTLEHLWPDEAIRLLREFYRILKPTCWLRINIPDIEKYINFYIGKKSSPEFLRFNTGCQAISTMTQNYGHHSAWDVTLLTLTLKNTGFIKVKKVEFGIEGTDKRIIKEEEVRKWETIVVEAQKP